MVRSVQDERTYRLSFTGQAEPYVGWASGHIANIQYEASTNTTTADMVADSAEKTSMILGFRHTNGGLKNVKFSQSTSENGPAQSGAARDYGSQLCNEPKAMHG